MDCPLCAPKLVALSGELVYVQPESNPVSRGHVLIVPYRHVRSYFDATPQEKAAILEMIDRAKKWLQEQYSPDAFNIGVNCGVDTGETIKHLHVHLIPRYKGDFREPVCPRGHPMDAEHHSESEHPKVQSSRDPFPGESQNSA